MKKVRMNKYEKISNTILTIMLFVFLIPILMIFIMSISSEDDVVRFGFSFIPKHVSFEAYKVILQDFSTLGRSIVVTLISAAINPLLTIIVNVMIAYPLSRDDFKYKNIVTKILMVVMFLAPVQVASYIVDTQYYGLGNNIMKYILPSVLPWTVFLFRTYFKQIPAALIESAEIDGASEFQIITKILLPLSKSIFAIQYFNRFVILWNDYQTSLLYMTDSRFYTIQHYLMRILQDAQFLRQAYQNSGMVMENGIPIETMKFAVCVISIIPVFLLFPYMQKYFSKGIAVGAVKG